MWLLLHIFTEYQLDAGVPGDALVNRAGWLEIQWLWNVYMREMEQRM